MLTRLFSKLECFVPLKWRWVLSHDGFKRYFTNTGWLFFGQLFSLLVSFFVGAWLARYLGPENYGVLNYSIAFAGLFGFLAYLSADNITSRELIKQPEQRDSLLGTAVVLKTIGGLGAFILALVAVFIFEGDTLIRLLVILYALSFLIQAPGIVGVFFQSQVKAKPVVLVQLLALAISSVLKISIIILHGSVVLVVVVYALDVLWNSIFLLLAYRASGLNARQWKFSRPLAKRIMHDSLFVMLASVSWFIYIKIDQIIVGNLLGQRAVGLYAAAVKIAEIWYFIPGVICASLFPAIVSAKEQGERIYRHRLKFFYLLLLVLAFVIALGVSLLSKLAITVVYGSAYLAAVPILQIYTWSSIGMFLSVGVSQYLTAENMMRTSFLISLIGMAANIILNFILIPRLGLTGAALASLISYLIAPLLILSFNKFWKRRIN